MTAPAAAAAASFVDRIDAVLPQTQCRRCGYADCRAYAQAIADGDAAINRCPPGGVDGIARLASVTARPPLALDAECGSEVPRAVAAIDEAWCIGCTLCIKACPVDCIVGAPKRMHTVVEADCTGCELCLPACPVDCIALLPSDAGERTGWQAWSAARAEAARWRYRAHRERIARDERADEQRLAGGTAGRVAGTAAATAALTAAGPSADPDGDAG